MTVCCFRRTVVDKQGSVVHGVSLGLYRSYSGIDIGLRLGILRVRVVAYETIAHHAEETVCTEKLREVFLSRIAAVLIESQDRGLTLLIVSTTQAGLTQEFEQARIELCIVACTMVVEPQTVIHMCKCPDIVSEEVATSLEVVIHMSQITFSGIDTRCTHTHIPHSDV